VSKAIAAVEEKAMAEASELAIARVKAQFLQSNITTNGTLTLSMEEYPCAGFKHLISSFLVLPLF